MPHIPFILSTPLSPIAKTPVGKTSQNSPEISPQNTPEIDFLDPEYECKMGFPEFVEDEEVENKPSGRRRNLDRTAKS